MLDLEVDKLYEQLCGNNEIILSGLSEEIIGALSISNNYLNLILENQSVIFNISGDTMFLYEINARGFGTNLMLQLIKKSIDDGLRYIKLEVKPLNIEEDSVDFEKIKKYLFSFYTSFGFKNTINTNYCILDLDDEEIIKALNNKLNYYLNNKNWIVLK